MSKTGGALDSLLPRANAARQPAAAGVRPGACNIPSKALATLLAAAFLAVPIPAWGQVRARTLLAGVRASVWAVSFSPDGKVLAALGETSGPDGSEAYVWLWDAKTGKDKAKLRCKWGTVRWLLAFTPDGKSLVSSCRRPDKRPVGANLTTVEVWDLKTAKVRLRIDLPEDLGGIGVITGDSKTLIVGGANIGLYDLSTGKQITVLKGTGPSVFQSLALSRDGKCLAAGRTDGKLTIWDFRARKLVKTINAHDQPVTAVAFSPDGKQLATTGAERTVALWDRAKGDLEGRQSLRPHLGIPNGTTFTKDGKGVIVGGLYGRGGGFVLWAPGGKKFRTGPVGKPVDIYCIALSPDGKTLATGGRTVTLWDLTKRPKEK